MHCLIVFSAAAWLLAVAPHAAGSCAGCHAAESTGMAPFHQVSCSVCHAGEPDAAEAQAAHAGLIAYPGNLSNAAATCGACHPQQAASVPANMMATGAGMVRTTRKVFGEPETGAIADLGHSHADTLLRTRCVMCHLGRDKRERRVDVNDRGGGCLACHVNAYPPDAHPRITRKVTDDRCFGCHSRSGRAALGYAGLAEVTEDALEHLPDDRLGRLPDGRLVQRKAGDVHHRAGLACIDCHTAAGLMGAAGHARHAAQAVDIACTDCHGPGTRADAAGHLLTANRGSVLEHVTVRGGDRALTRRIAGGSVAIPAYTNGSHPLETEHARLTCNACHTQWAHQCYGCHTSYDPSGSSWDHLTDQPVAGRWEERRWGVTSGLPALGVDADDRVTTVIPGMIMTLEHPSWDEPRFVRLFAPTSAHTTGRARSCASCHCAPEALGFGSGTWGADRAWREFTPSSPPAADGLPADAWTSPRGDGGGSAHAGLRPLTPVELDRIVAVDIDCRGDAAR